LPTKVRFGFGISGELENEIKALGKKTIMLVTDKGLIRAGIVDKVLAQLGDEMKKDLTVFDEVEPNPRDTTVQRAYETAKAKGVDVLVAVGGGSSMDVAKGVGVLLTNGGLIGDYEGLDQVKKEAAPIIAIPTTVGTGSEVTFWSVITDTKRHFKMSVGSTMLAPKVALVDPHLVVSLPPAIIASTGMDALTHAIEGYTCKLSEPITDACGIYAIRYIAENIRDAVYTDSKEARAKMLLGSLIAGICFGNSDIAAVHAMAEALGGLYDTPHGIANAIMLPYVMEYNYVASTKKFARIADALGENVIGDSERDAAYKAVTAVRKLNEDLNIPTLKEIGAKAEDFEDLSAKSEVNVSTESNPRKITKDDFLKIFRKAYA
jgi:alcohol dehydrogenase